jgi:lysophospholipase L1-like esterase
MRSLLLTFVFALSFSSFAEETKITNANPGVGPIAVVGDSLARGAGATDAELAPAGCFRNNFPGEVHALGVDGRTSEGVLANLNQATDKKPKLVFVSSGGNDAINDYYFGNYPEQKTMEQMNEIFDRLLATGAVVAYLGLNPPYPQAVRLPKISDLAKTKGVIVVDGMNGMWGTDQMADEFHPNDKGYTEMCRRIVEAVRGHYP